jgi:hypothetical protein
MAASSPAQDRAETEAPEDGPETIGAMDELFDFQRALRIEADLSDLEKRNLSIIEGAWVDAENDGLDTKAFHPDRFRMQLPMQKCSYNLDIAKDVAAVVKEAAPDKKTRLGMTYAKGNQVVAEGVVSWSRDGSATETPFITFLLLDEDGSIIRERRYHAMESWPGADGMMQRLGL